MTKRTCDLTKFNRWYRANVDALAMQQQWECINWFEALNYMRLYCAVTGGGFDTEHLVVALVTVLSIIHARGTARGPGGGISLP